MKKYRVEFVWNKDKPSVRRVLRGKVGTKWLGESSFGMIVGANSEKEALVIAERVFDKIPEEEPMNLTMWQRFQEMCSEINI